jgi:hypothetical protein
MKIWNITAITLTLVALSSCAHHSLMRGSVAMKENDREAHVCLGENEVKVGDRVAAFRNECKSRGGQVAEKGSRGVSCKLEKIGEGKVVSILNDHYSTVEFDQGVPFEEGTVVQKE